jgi:hypothetical protein
VRCGFLLCVLAGCAGWSTTFAPRDPTYEARRVEGPVDVFLYAPPARPYRPVGVIEVTSPSGRPPLQELVDRALVKAREVGCDLLVVRSLHRAALRLPVLVAQRVDPTGLPPGETLGASEPAARRGQFVCGVYTQP